LLADVTGHGLGAALDASSVNVAFRSASSETGEPGGVLSRMNQFLAPHTNFRFVTALCARIDLRSNTILFAEAGHPPFLVVTDGEATSYELRGNLLGFRPEDIYEEMSVGFAPGARLLFFTDG